MKLRVLSLFAIITVFAAFSSISAQVETAIGQVSFSNSEAFAGGMSGDGRFVVFESRGNVATVNPRNADRNVEIFLFDYAQRRIFQLTDTKVVLIDTDEPITFDNVRVEITNTRPVISNDGKWIAFSSNATTSTPKTPDATNPSSFDGNAYTDADGDNPLTLDANLEMWVYQIPTYTPADLTTGEEIPYTALDTGSFTRITNTPASQLPVPGTKTTGAFVADDNHDASINDDGNVIAFVSTRDLVTGGNPFPEADNDEIFSYIRSTATISQITKTERGSIGDPIYNKNPTISGSGTRVIFASTGDNPIIGMTDGTNPSTSRNEEIFAADLNAAGAPAGTQRQITTTTPLTPGAPVNILDLGRRMSRDGNFLAFDSYADLANENGGTNQTTFATYLYDYTANTFRRMLPRSGADATATGGDVQRYPVFTDNNISGTPSSVILQTRLNIMPAGTVATVNDDGLNPEASRPPQFYRFPIAVPVPPAPDAVYTRLTKFPPPGSQFIPSSQALASNSSKRFAFNLAITELGTGNLDRLSQVYYSYEPQVINEARAVFSFTTGASNMPVSPTAVPSPSPTATPSPTPTPTPSPTPTPTGSPTPTPSPTPVTPPAVLGISPGMLAILNYTPGLSTPTVQRTAVGAIDRVFDLPMELSGVSMTINGIACGMKSVNRHQITFVAPKFLSSAVAGTSYPVVVNNQGTILRGNVTVVPTRPDVFNIQMAPQSGGRAYAKNVTNRVATGEPFTVVTVKYRGGKRVPTVLRLRVTGIGNTTAPVISIRMGSYTATGARVLTGGVLAEPGVYTVDFTVPPELKYAGDVPIIVIVNANGTLFTSRLDDTAPKLNFL